MRDLERIPLPAVGVHEITKPHLLPRPVWLRLPH